MDQLGNSSTQVRRGFSSLHCVLRSAQIVGLVLATAFHLLAQPSAASALVNISPPHQSTNVPANILLSWAPPLDQGNDILINGDFESIDLAGWTIQCDGMGEFYHSTATQEALALFNGAPGVLADQSGPGVQTLYQEFFIPADAPSATLSWVDYVQNYFDTFTTNQAYRVELRDRSDRWLATLFSTSPGDPLEIGWNYRYCNLSPWRGHLIRLAFVIDSTRYRLQVGLCNVHLRLPDAGTTYSVYLGTDQSPLDLIGTTTNTFFSPGVLPPGTYRWQVQLGPPNLIAAPIWEFTTAPTLMIGDEKVTQPNAGIQTNAYINVWLTAPTTNQVTVNYSTSDDTAWANVDYVPAPSGTLQFKPGESLKVITLTINGTDRPEPRKTFFVTVTNQNELPIGRASGVCTLLNGSPPVIDHFVWGSISPIQEPGYPIQLSLKAVDSLGNLISNLNASVSISGIATQYCRILGDITPGVWNAIGDYTLGYTFVLDQDVVATDACSFGGQKVSLWDEDGALLINLDVPAIPGEWITTPLPAPLPLAANRRYRLGVYTQAGPYYWQLDATNAFAHGSMEQGCFTFGDGFPDLPVDQQRYFVDLRFVASDPLSVPLSFITLTLTNGVWSGSLLIPASMTNIMLVASDQSGHTGQSAVFSTLIIPRTITTRADVSGLTLSWPAPEGGFVLEETDDLASPNWAPVPEPPTIVGRQLRVTVFPTSSSKFFRLQRK